jgi:HPt (histidine-containing phosphotransfer) domain-containing protein
MGAEDTQQSEMSAALDQLWKQYLPTMKERVTVLEEAARILEGRELTENERVHANNAAHKLAGVLGTFGLTRGTVLARQTEILYSGDPGTDPADAEQLRGIAAQLRAMLMERK